MKNTEEKMIIQTTLGDLIAVLTQEVLLVARDKKKVNGLVAEMLSDLLATADASPNGWH